MLTRAEQARYLARGSAAAVWAVLPLPADGEAPVLLAFALRCGRTVLAVLPTILPMALPAGTPLVVTVPLVETVVGVPLRRLHDLRLRFFGIHDFIANKSRKHDEIKRHQRGKYPLHSYSLWAG